MMRKTANISCSVLLFFVCLLTACEKNYKTLGPGEPDTFEERTVDATNRVHLLQKCWTNDKVLSDIHTRDSIRRELEAKLNDTSQKLDSRSRMEMLATLAQICRKSYDFTEAMSYCSEGMSIAAKEYDKEMDAFFESYMGQMLFDVEEYSGAGSHLWNGYSLLADSKEPKLMKACGQYALESFEFQFQLMKYDHAIITVMAALTRFEDSYKADPTLWTPEEYDSLHGTALIDAARLYARIDQHDEAKKYYDRFLDTHYAKTDDGIFHEVRYLYRDKQYEKALQRYSVLEQHVDTMDESYTHVTAFLPRMRMRKVVILQAMERWKECCEAYESYEEARHYWTKRSNSFKMLEAYERHGVAREQAFSEDVRRVANIRGWVITALVVLLVLVLGLCSILLHMQKVIRKKNKVLATNILHQIEESKSAQQKQVAEAEKTTDAGTNDNDFAVYVNRFIRAVTQRKLFCNEDFNRDALLQELQIPHRGFSHAFELCTGTSIQQYIINLRLEYAADLIRIKPEYTIDSIARESGFSGRSTFYRNFVRQFGITPSEYKNQIG